MTSPRKALIRYDLLTAGALGCAALLLVMLFAGCNRAKAKSADSAMNFIVAKWTVPMGLLRACAHRSLEAQLLP
jgi:hypothetical protein